MGSHGKRFTLQKNQNEWPIQLDYEDLTAQKKINELNTFI